MIAKNIARLASLAIIRELQFTACGKIPREATVGFYIFSFTFFPFSKQFVMFSQENKKKSPAWKLFRMINREKASCTICLETISTSGRNTTGITRHAEKLHPLEFINAKKEASKSMQIAQCTTSLLALSFATGGIPFQFMENRYFQMFLEKVGYEGIGADTMRKFILELADESLKILRKQIETESFVGCRNIQGKATAENVAATLAAIMDRVDCDFSRIHHVVTDGANNLVKLSDTMNIQSFAKVLCNTAKHPKTFSPTRWGGGFLLIRDFMESLDVLRSVPELVEFVPSREEKLMGNICVDLLDSIFDVMTELEGDDSTASCIIPNLVAIQKVLDLHQYKATRIGRMARSNFKSCAEVFLKDPFLRKSCFLDPRFAYFDEAIAPIKWSTVEKNFIKTYEKENPLNRLIVDKDPEPPAKKSKTSPLADLMFKQKEESGSSSLKVQKNNNTGVGQNYLQNEVATYKSQITGINGRPPLKSDPLDYWKTNQFMYPFLSNLARDYLSVPSSSASTERLFSKATGLVSNIKRNRMSPETLDAILQVSCRGQLISENSKIFQQEEYTSEDDEELVNQEEDGNDENNDESCTGIKDSNELDGIAELPPQLADKYGCGDHVIRSGEISLEENTEYSENDLEE
ncbi:hypothetical protein CRE_19534 [Caenorhabditis remanei]|uniref:BED-type domain-containing protein n=1 Tax=Caenorhabditis remanei TaxID=31234 RepID=E3NJ85_CAERE|nr:hypothetical protein CRE_19534 [Caenorhabditis remanei]